MLGVGASGGQAATVALPLAEADPLAALGAGVGVFVVLFVFACGFLIVSPDDESWGAGDRRLLMASALCSAAGMVVCFVGLTLDVHSWDFIAAGLLAVGYFGCIAAVVRRRVAMPTDGPLPKQQGKLGRGWLYPSAAVSCLLSLGLVGWLFWNGAQLDPGVAAKSFHVKWTCTDGVCSVNECTSPEPCGKQAVGRLEEGAVAEITCQTRGGWVGARREGSTIWDKLVDGNYVTDFYIDTPERDRFTLAVPRCAEGSAQ
jgi:hypothetical protein